MDKIFLELKQRIENEKKAALDGDAKYAEGYRDGLKAAIMLIRDRVEETANVCGFYCE